MKNFVFLLLSIIVITGCDSQRLFEENHSFENYSWHKDSIIEFETDSLYNLGNSIYFEFNLRNTIEYKYRNFWAFIEIDFPGGLVVKDTIPHALMSPDGIWLPGVEGSNGIKESRFRYEKRVVRPENGVYKIKIQQGMREQVLEDVVNVGARIIKFTE